MRGTVNESNLTIVERHNMKIKRVSFMKNIFFL